MFVLNLIFPIYRKTPHIFPGTKFEKYKVDLVPGQTRWVV